MDALLTAEEVARLLHISTKGLATLRYRRIGPRFVRTGSRQVRYRASDVEAWLTARVVEQGGDPAAERKAVG